MTYNNGTRQASHASEIFEGLTQSGQKELHCKYLYDDVGSAIFEVISLLPEYGLTRADERLLHRYSEDIVAGLPKPLRVAELGSGSGKKTRWILESVAKYQATNYHPIEISSAALARCQQELGALDHVKIFGLQKEYLDGIRAVASLRAESEHLLILFLGSSIGNFNRDDATQFLQDLRQTMQQGDSLLLGTDLVKPVEEVLLAYDDPVGVTAAFNMNTLARFNREFGATFNLAQFRHEVRWDAVEKRIEMHLRSLRDQSVSFTGPGFEIFLKKDETIWTESSYKYTVDEVQHLSGRSGFRCENQWIDDEWAFAQNLLIAI